MNDNDFAQKKQELLQPLLNKYHFKKYIYKDNTALIGKEHIILFLTDKWNTDVFYLQWRKNGIWEYPINNFVRSSITAQDRNGIIWEHTPREHALADLQVIIRALENHWENILKGNEDWIEILYNNSPYGYPPRISQCPEIKKFQQIMGQ